MDMLANNAEEPLLEKSWEKFPGHIAPATIFCGFSLYALLKTLWLTKELPPNRTFAQVHIPYRDKQNIRTIGTVVCLLTFAGVLYHAAGEGIDMSLKLHMILYSCFLTAGFTGILESYDRLPPDSSRIVIALAFFLASFLWRAHGMMMPEPTNQSVHVCLGYLNLATALAFAYSVTRKDSTVAHVVAWALLMVQGIWLYVIAFYLCCIEISVFMVEAYLCLISILVTAAIVIVVAWSGLPQIRETHNQINPWVVDGVVDGRGHYEVVAKLNGSHHGIGLSGGSESTAESQEELSHEDDAC